MNFSRIDKLKVAYKQSLYEIRFLKLSFILTLLFFLSCFYPTDSSFYQDKRRAQSGDFVYFTEHYLRFTTTIAAVAIPIYKKDIVGFMQMINVSLGTTITTQTLKRVLNRATTINGRRLGERPSSQTSRYNMPSGHSSMVSCAAFFIIIRYRLFKKRSGFAFAIILLLLCFATMYGRVMLDAHTISATIAGFITGGINALVFTSALKFKRENNQKE